MNAPFELGFKPRRQLRARRREAPPFSRKILFEALEPRLLLSADAASPALAEALAASLNPTQATQQETALPLQDTTPVLIMSDVQASVDVDVTAETWIIDAQSALPEGEAAARGQTVFLDLDGAQHVDYEGPVLVEDIDVDPFRAPSELAGQEAEIIAALLDVLDDKYAGIEIDFALEQPVNGDYSTVYIGGDGAAFADYGWYVGLSEKIDEGNRDQNDNAFVFSENFVTSGLTAQQYGETPRRVGGARGWAPAGWCTCAHGGRDTGPAR